ncbi:MAG: phospholipase D-like domain-containing protein [Acidobacteriaceae bacterium]
MIRYIVKYLLASLLCAAMWMGIRGCSGNFAPYRRSADLDSRSFTPASALHSVTSYSRKFLNTPVDVPSQGTAIHYAPAEDLEHIDAQLMEKTTSDHLDIAMYAFTDVPIARAVVDVANRGVKVAIYRDEEQFAQEQRREPYVLAMLRSNPNISIRVKDSRVLMHIKGWSDGTILREGSANWSRSGELEQDNTLLLTKDPQSVQGFERNFQHIFWQRTSNLLVQ